jgi:hypothetical protein
MGSRFRVQGSKASNYAPCLNYPIYIQNKLNAHWKKRIYKPDETGT